MLNFIENIDRWLFYLINKGTANPVFDSVFPYITTNEHWFLVYIFLFGWLFWKGGRNGRICAITLIFGIIISDQINSAFIKELVSRLRPCHVLADVHLLVPCGGGKSFMSSHAVNTFTGAFILSHFFRKYKYIYFGIAVLIAFSRVYVGVHYPFDVICGAGFGIGVGFLLIKLEKIVEEKILKRN